MQANSSEINSPPQANSSLADRLRWVLTHFHIQQSELAVDMGVNVDRVKSLVLGRARKIRADELLRLSAARSVSTEWLANGKLPALLDRSQARPAATAPAGAVGRADLDAAVLVRDVAPTAYAGRDISKSGDSALLLEVVERTAAELDASGVQLSPERRLRLYWAVFELSLPNRQVNTAALGPLINLARSTG